MLNTAIRISTVDAKHAQVNWTTAWPDGASWIFVNGKKVLGPFVTGTADRAMKILLEFDHVAAIEVHDFETTDEIPGAIEDQPNTRPILGWRDVADAVAFRIYHMERDDASETKIYDRPRRVGQERHHILCPIILSGLGGIWHLFRVEAVDIYGNESVRQAWAYWVAEPPLAPGVSVVEGSGAGLYTVTVTEP